MDAFSVLNQLCRKSLSQSCTTQQQPQQWVQHPKSLIAQRLLTVSIEHLHFLEIERALEVGKVMLVFCACHPEPGVDHTFIVALKPDT